MILKCKFSPKQISCEGFGCHVPSGIHWVILSSCGTWPGLHWYLAVVPTPVQTLSELTMKPSVGEGGLPHPPAVKGICSYLYQCGCIMTQSSRKRGKWEQCHREVCILNYRSSGRTTGLGSSNRGTSKLSVSCASMHGLYTYSHMHMHIHMHLRNIYTSCSCQMSFTEMKHMYM